MRHHHEATGHARERFEERYGYVLDRSDWQRIAETIADLPHELLSRRGVLEEREALVRILLDRGALTVPMVYTVTPRAVRILTVKPGGFWTATRTRTHERRS